VHYRVIHQPTVMASQGTINSSTSFSGPETSVSGATPKSSPAGQTQISVNSRKPKKAAKWRNLEAEDAAREAARENVKKKLFGSLTGDQVKDYETLRSMGYSSDAAENLSEQMLFAMSGVCDWCGRRGGCGC